MARRSKTSALLATVALLWLGSSADALKSNVGKKKLAVERSPQAALQQQQQPADALVDPHDHPHEDSEDDSESETAVRCRFCGATVAFKRSVRATAVSIGAITWKREADTVRWMCAATTSDCTTRPMLWRPSARASSATMGSCTHS